MKHLLYLFSFLMLAIASLQCSDELTDIQQSDGPLSRAIAPIDTSETNPYLMTSWENCRTVKLNVVEPNGANKEVTLPWRDGAESSLSSKFCEDIKSADGWKMIFHTFCKSNTDVDLSYMGLYNIFTGYLKVFYYSPNPDVGTSTIWHISSADRELPQPLFADLEYFSQPLEGDNYFTIWSVTADNMRTVTQSGLKHGWNGFEFRVGEYHPENTTEKICIDAYNTAYINMSIAGVTESTTNGTITTTNSSSSSGGKTVDALVSLGGNEAKQLVDSFAVHNLNKTFWGINVKNIVTSIAKQDYVSAIKSGLGFIFKGLFKKEPTVQEVKLQTNGTVTLDGKGSMELTSAVVAITFDLGKVMTAGKPILLDSIKPIYPRDSLHPGPVVPGPIEPGPIGPQYMATINPALTNLSFTSLGVWNLKKKPTIYYDRYTKFENGYEFSDKDFIGGMLDFNGMVEFPNTRVDDIEVVFNPVIRHYVRSYNVSVGMIDVEGGNRRFNNRGKNIISLDRRNLLKNDQARNIQVYGVDYYESPLAGSLYDYPSNIINNDTQLYIDWGDNVGGYRAAVVTLTMDVDYKGKKMSFTESRIYDVVYKPYTNPGLESFVNNPPETYVLNQPGNKIIGFYLH